MKKFWVCDKDFPQANYEVSEEELIQMLEQGQFPDWWRKHYQQVLLRSWDEKESNGSSRSVCS